MYSCLLLQQSGKILSICVWPNTRNKSPFYERSETGLQSCDFLGVLLYLEYF